MNKRSDTLKLNRIYQKVGVTAQEALDNLADNLKKDKPQNTEAMHEFYFNEMDSRVSTGDLYRLDGGQTFMVVEDEREGGVVYLLVRLDTGKVVAESDNPEHLIRNEKFVGRNMQFHISQKPQR